VQVYILASPPTNAAITGGTVAENSAIGTLVGTVAGFDQDAGSTLHIEQ
jgi:hypothetical protein